MTLRLGPTEFDPADRPLVVAHDDPAGVEPVDKVLKQAVGQGADVVELPFARLDSAETGVETERIPVCVVVSSLAELEGVTRLGAVAVRWSGAPTRGSVLRRAAPGVPLVWSTTDPDDGPVPGDWLIVPVERCAALAERAPGVIGLIDLGIRSDRAELAALVTLALEGPVDGFVTVSPTTVRRTAHVIRAVERSR